jgi:3-hydroxyacyl-[acyl-carrier-protein] dehydratase
MLQGDFFTITTLQADHNTVNAVLEINAAHRIFEGHFPGQPVVPGVCMMQMVKEVMEKAIGHTTRLVKADHLKFLSMVNPRENNTITAQLKYVQADNGEIQVTGSLLNGTATCLKFSGVLSGVEVSKYPKP